jgi:hypothetical protein
MGRLEDAKEKINAVIITAKRAQTAAEILIESYNRTLNSGNDAKIIELADRLNVSDIKEN